MSLTKTVAPVKLIGIPQDNNSSYLTGSSMAPARIREAIHCDSANLWTETGFDLSDPESWEDMGDLPIVGKSGEAAFDLIKSSVSELIGHGHGVLSLGGDHSISYPAIMAHTEVYDHLNVLHIDAHPDLYDEMQDNRFSHASPFARLMESGRLGRLVQVGVRTLNGHQRAQAEKFGVEIHEMRDLEGVSSIEFSGPVYLSVDMDGLDPAFAPGVSHYEPGGLSTREVLNIIQKFSGQMIGGDIVELNPHRDPGNITAMVAAKLAKEMMGRLLMDGPIKT